MLHYHSGKISGSQQGWPFALSNNERKLLAPVLFLIAIMDGKVLHGIFSFFLPYLKDHGF